MDSCIFCKIVNGQIPSAKIFDSDHVIGIKDLHPQAPTHYLFLPKKHYQSVSDVPATELEVMAKLFGALMEVSKREGFDKRGFRTVINTGVEGGQTVPHLHVHFLAGKKLSEKMTQG